MAKTSKQIYVCDRCGVEDHDPDIDQRKNWTTIENDGVLHKQKDYLICYDCLKDLEIWLSLPPLERPKPEKVKFSLGGVFR